ncbi:hypothetical protein NQ315_005018, partial [Exocentrus adspersus]
CVMSMKKLAILSAIHNDGRLNGTDMFPTPGSPPSRCMGLTLCWEVKEYIRAMLSGIILVVFILCYCCHKTNRKSQSNLPTYWRDPGLSMEIYTVESAQNWLVSDDLSCDIHRTPSPGPPPAYDVVVPLNKECEALNKEDDTELPSYETAVQHLKISSTHGYV